MCVCFFCFFFSYICKNRYCHSGLKLNYHVTGHRWTFAFASAWKNLVIATIGSVGMLFGPFALKSLNSIERTCLNQGKKPPPPYIPNTSWTLWWSAGPAKKIFSIYGIEPGHWPNELSIHKRSGRSGFNPRSHHTKDSKNGTWYRLA